MTSEPHWTTQENFSFDYFRATVYESAKMIEQQLVNAMEPACGMLVSEDRGKAPHYEKSIALVDGFGKTRVRVLFNSGNDCNVIGTGADAELVANVIRCYKHRPSRVDICIDAVGEGLWDRIKAHSIRFAAAKGIGRSTIENDSPDKGDTIYLGSRRSQSFLRIYQKGLKEAQDAGVKPEEIHEHARDAVRIELEFKPQSNTAKVFASTAKHRAFFGACSWTKEYLQSMLRIEADRYVVSERRESNRDRALRFMTKQYAAHLTSLLEECDGSFEAFGESIFDLVQVNAD